MILSNDVEIPAHTPKIPNNISKLANEKLVEWIDDMKGEVKTKTK